jgi:spore maturation protein CgeB
MTRGLHISFFGSSLVSAYWNGAATYYRGILRALAERGHHITFYEPDAYERQRHRDIPDPPWAEVVVYAGDRLAAADAALASAAGSDLVVKASGVGVYDTWLERQVLRLRGDTRVVFWDVDAPATIERLRGDLGDPFRPLVPEYDLVFTYGGGPPVVRAYGELGARRCVPIYNALDPTTHHPAAPDPRFAGDLGLLANRLPDREERIEEFFLDVARRLPQMTFVLGGNGWETAQLPPNVRAVGHVYTADHNAFNASTRAVLNVHRESMARFGHSPATRVFEAAGAGACLISDSFVGVEAFLEPGREILLARGGGDVAELLLALHPERAGAIGQRARERVLREHTYAHRALEVEAALAALWPEPARAPVTDESGRALADAGVAP